MEAVTMATSEGCGEAEVFTCSLVRKCNVPFPEPIMEGSTAQTQGS